MQDPIKSSLKQNGETSPFEEALLWTFLGKHSQEISDLQKGLASFAEAEREGCNSSSFRLEYGRALLYYGNIRGDPQILEKALSLFREVIADLYFPDEEPAPDYLQAWLLYVQTMKNRYSLTHLSEHFEEANIAFREAILALPKESELWLDWGELFLYGGWCRRHLKLVETGLEKLTSTKIKECDPLRVSALLGEGLIFLGIFLENLKFIHDGRDRLLNALEIAPDNAHLISSLGFAHLGLALYFSNEEEYAKAVETFTRGLQLDAMAIENWYSLFQAYVGWGMKKRDPSLIQKGVEAIARVSSLRPFSHLHLNEWGVALLRLRTLEPDLENQQIYVERAICKFREAYSLFESDETLYNWGCALDLLGDLTGDEEDYGRAVEILNKIYEKDPAIQPVRYQLGLALSHLGEVTMNVDCLSQAIELLGSVAKEVQDDEQIFCELGSTILNLAELIYEPIHPQKGDAMRKNAEKILMYAASLGSGEACYHLACLYSLTGHYSVSIEFLKRAEQANCLPPDLESDEWLAGVRETEAFQEFLMTRNDNG